MNLLKYVAMFGLVASFTGLLACSGDVAGTTEDENTVIAIDDGQKSSASDSSGVDSSADGKNSSGNDVGYVDDSTDVEGPDSLDSISSSSSSAGSSFSDSVSVVVVTSSVSSEILVFSSGSEGKMGHGFDSAGSGDDPVLIVSSSSESATDVLSSSSSQGSPISGSEEPARSNWVYGAWTADTVSGGIVGAVGSCIAGGPFGETVVPVVDNGVHNFGGNGAVTSSGTVDATYFDSVSDTLFSGRVEKLVGDGLSQAEAEKQVVAEFYSLIHADEMEALTQTKVENYVVKRLAGYVLNSISRYTWVQNKSEFVRNGDIQDSTVCTWAYLPTLSLAAEAIPKLLPANCSVEKDDAEALQKLLVFAWAACRELPVCDASSEGTEVRVESVVTSAETVVCKDMTWTVKTAGSN